LETRISVDLPRRKDYLSLKEVLSVRGKAWIRIAESPYVLLQHYLRVATADFLAASCAIRRQIWKEA
jgi:hypothetical protein